ncbi:MAG TPA: hypothetical protein VFF67_01025 [Thermoplasmata archaeon]|nr:hypothetical protein [Thermoplasmata archaeon]
MRSKGSSSPDRFRRIGGIASYGFAAVVVVSVAVAPMAGALKQHTILPPFKGSASSIIRAVSLYGNCKVSSALYALHWVPRSGNITGIAYSSAKGCVTFSTGNGSSSASSSADLQVAFPVRFSTNAGHNFSVAFSYDYTLLASISGATNCPVAQNVPGTYTSSDCHVDVSAGSQFMMELYDQTNGSYLGGEHGFFDAPENYTVVSNFSFCNGHGGCSNGNNAYSCQNSTVSSCAPSGSTVAGSNAAWIDTGANCRFSYAGHCSYWSNWTLNSSHRFWVIAIVEISTYATIYGYGAGHGVLAKVNSATLGNAGWKITSVTVT